MLPIAIGIVIETSSRPKKVNRLLSTYFMKYCYLVLSFVFLQSCNFVHILSISEQRNTTEQEQELFLSNGKYICDFSFEVVDTLHKDLYSKRHMLFLDNEKLFSAVQLRIYNSNGDLYTGFSQCTGDFVAKKPFATFPPEKKSHPYINTDLKFEHELELLKISEEEKQQVRSQAKNYPKTVVLYWAKYTGYFSKHILKNITKLKRENPNDFCLILINLVRDL